MKRARGSKYNNLNDTPEQKRRKVEAQAVLEQKMKQVMKFSTYPENSPQRAELIAILNDLDNYENNFLIQICLKITSVYKQRDLYAFYMETIKRILDCSGAALVNLPNTMGNTALHFVSHAPGNIVEPLINLLLSIDGVNVNATNRFGNTWIHEFVRTNQCPLSYNLLTRFIEVGGDLNITNCNDDTALHIAACQSGINSVFALRSTQSLVKAGAKYDMLNNQNFTPFQCAVHENFKKLVEFYVKSGVDIERELDLLNPFYKSEYTKTILLPGQFACPLYILRNYILDFFQENMGFHQSYNNLEIALRSSSGYKHIIEVRGGEFHDAFFKHYTKITIKPQIATLVKQINLLYILIKQKALIPNGVTIKCVIDFLPYLTKICFTNRRSFCADTETMLSLIADLSQNNKWNNIIEHVAKLLIEHYKNDPAYNMTFIYSKALYNACKSGNKAVCRQILEADPSNVNMIVQQHTKTIPLHLALKFRWECLIPILIEHGADVNLTNSKQNTALHLAVWFQLEAATAAILNTGVALMDLKNASYKTPLEIAQDSGNQKIIALLLNATRQKSEVMDAMEL